jgi:hypothetical protein
LRAEPQPYASCRAEFGEAVEDSMDRPLRDHDILPRNICLMF